MPDRVKKKKVIFIIGPTAVGKSRVGASLASRLDAEVISCDSMQIYKGMDIITSKPALSLRNKIPHHLIDIISPCVEYNVSKYRRQALRKIKEVLARDKIPIVVGGTGLYISILIDGIFKIKSGNNAVRRRLYLEAEKRGGGYLYRRLKKVDPESAVKIHPHDIRRIVRSLEVFELSGRPISQLKKEREGLDKKYEVKVFYLDMERQRLYERIEERVERMFRQGLLKEAGQLLGLRLSRTAKSAIGLKELEGYFSGLYDLDEAKRRIKQNTRNYAKRQLTWFRKEKRARRVRIADKDRPGSVAARICRDLNKCL